MSLRERGSSVGREWSGDAEGRDDLSGLGEEQMSPQQAVLAPLAEMARPVRVPATRLHPGGSKRRARGTQLLPALIHSFSHGGR